MRAGPLSQTAVVDLLQPFVVTAWHGAGPPEMPADVKEIFTESEQSKDPKRLNTFIFVLNTQGKLVHGFHGLSGRGDGRSDHKAEITKALEKLNLPADVLARKERLPLALPDLKPTETGSPAGLRLFVKRGEPGSRAPVVEAVPLSADEWKVLALPEAAKEIEAEALRNCLVQLYPPAIRTADQRKPFRTIAGKLKLEPAGADAKGRYALLRGEIRLAKGDDKESAFEGKIAAVLTYRADTAEVQSLRGFAEGDYLYRVRGTQRIPLVAAIESRPE